jgi:hypothetical protein
LNAGEAATPESTTAIDTLPPWESLWAGSRSMMLEARTDFSLADGE